MAKRAATSTAPSVAEALPDQQTATRARLKEAQDDLEAQIDVQYPQLTEDGIVPLVMHGHLRKMGFAA
jgi:hypothetical protein